MHFPTARRLLSPLRVPITRCWPHSMCPPAHNVFLHKRLDALRPVVASTLVTANTIERLHVAETVMSSSPDSEPRPDLRRILSALVAGLVRVTPDRDLQAIFEQQLQRLLSMRSVRLREIPARYQARLVTPTRTADSIVLWRTPTANPRVQAVLEAYFEPGRPIEGSDFEMLESAADLGGLVLEAARTRTVLHACRPDGAAPLIGSTPVMKDLRDRIERVALTDFTVLIDGESGVGKELVARQLHDLGRRRHGPFVAVNCAAVVETLLEAELFGIEDRTATGVRGRRGKFEHADNGTLFLDEVSDLSLTAQAKLLRAIQDLSVERVGGNGLRRVNTRIVAATNRPSADLVARGLFRADLFYRLSGVEIHVPPLRDRRDDIEELLGYFLDSPPPDAGSARCRSPRSRRCATTTGRATSGSSSGSSSVPWRWPRPTRSSWTICLRRCAASTGRYWVPRSAAGETMRAWGSRYARFVFERCGRNKRRACRALDISYHTLQAYLRHYEGGQGAAARQIPAWARPVDDAARDAELVE